MNNVTATATGGTNNRGVFNENASPSMNNVTATATGGTNNSGVFNKQSSPLMNNVTATGIGGLGFNYGVNNDNASPSIRGSSIPGPTASVVNMSSSAKIADTTLIGVASGPGFTCVGVHNQDFVALNTSCL